MLGNCDFRENRPSKSLTEHSLLSVRCALIDFADIRAYRAERSAVQHVSSVTMLCRKDSAFLVGVNQISFSLYYEKK